VKNLNQTGYKTSVKPLLGREYINWQKSVFWGNLAKKSEAERNKVDNPATRVSTFWLHLAFDCDERRFKNQLAHTWWKIYGCNIEKEGQKTNMDITNDQQRHNCDFLKMIHISWTTSRFSSGDAKANLCEWFYPKKCKT